MLNGNEFMMDGPLRWLQTAPLWGRVGVVALWLGVIGGTAEWLHRQGWASGEVVRKIVHIGTGNVILFAWWLVLPAWLGIAASVLFGAIALLSYRYPILPGINSVGRKSLGTFFYAASIGLLVAWFWPLGQPAFAAIGVLIMTWGDGLAALIGQRWGRHPYKVGGMQKSWEGSGAMAGISFLVCGFILLAVRGPLVGVAAVALVTAIAATVLEAVSWWGVDNLTVPVGSAAIAFGLSLLWLP